MADVNIQGILHDDHFLALDSDAKKEILARHDPDFAQLPAAEQDKFVNDLHPGRGWMTGVVRDFPRVAGVLAGGARGAALGLEYGGPYGALAGGVVGAGVGAMGAEGLKALADKYILHNLQGDPGVLEKGGVVDRMNAAAGSGMTDYAVGETMGVPAKAGANWLKDTGVAAAKAVGSKIPIGVLEGVGGRAADVASSILSKLPGAARTMAQAGENQSDAIIKAGRDALEQIGGPLEALPAATTISRSLRQSGRAILAAAQNPSDLRFLGDFDLDSEINQLKDAIGRFGNTPETEGAVNRAMMRVFNVSKIAGELAKKPLAWAQTIQQVGADGMNELRRSWLTGILDSATVKEGKAAGLIDTNKILGPWDKLGESGQQTMFGELQPQINDFMEQIRPTRLAQLAIKRAKNLERSATGGIADVLRESPLASWAGLSTVLHTVFHEGPASALGQGAAVFLPWTAAKLLTTPGGAHVVANILGHSAVGSLEQAMPYLTQAATAVLHRAPPSMHEIQRATAEPFMHAVEAVAGGRPPGISKQ